MSFFRYLRRPRRLILTVIGAGGLMLWSMTMATEAVAPENQSPPEDSGPGLVSLAVSGASAGITTEYFEQAVTDALVASGIFSGIDDSETSEVIMPMIGAKGVFKSTISSGDTPYFLTIRVIEVDTPSFSIRMTVSMDAIWILYRTDEKVELLNENIHSTYTGGMFEGGIHGANRVRVAMEGATRENIRIGIGLLESLGLEQE